MTIAEGIVADNVQFLSSKQEGPKADIPDMAGYRELQEDDSPF